MEGINSHIMGGYLEGGIGEIQTMGVIKLIVEEQDFEQAKVLIREWENQRVDTDLDQDYDHETTVNLSESSSNINRSEQGQADKGASLIVSLLVVTVVVVLLLWYFLLPQ